MKKNMVIFNTWCFLIFGLNSLQAQEAVPAAGGNASGSRGTVSYTVGQVVYTHNTGSTGTVTQGVQQSSAIEVTNSTEEAKGITLICSALPNPVTDYLILKIEGGAKTQYIASLYDMNGKLLQNNKVNGNETIIQMENLAPSVYFLKVTDKQKKEIKTFKIIKD